MNSLSFPERLRAFNQENAFDKITEELEGNSETLVSYLAWSSLHKELIPQNASLTRLDKLARDIAQRKGTVASIQAVAQNRFQNEELQKVVDKLDLLDCGLITLFECRTDPLINKYIYDPQGTYLNKHPELIPKTRFLLLDDHLEQAYAKFVRDGDVLALLTDLSWAPLPDKALPYTYNVGDVIKDNILKRCILKSALQMAEKLKQEEIKKILALPTPLGMSLFAYGIHNCLLDKSILMKVFGLDVDLAPLYQVIQTSSPFNNYNDLWGTPKKEMYKIINEWLGPLDAAERAKGLFLCYLMGYHSVFLAQCAKSSEEDLHELFTAFGPEQTLEMLRLESPEGWNSPFNDPTIQNVERGDPCFSVSVYGSIEVYAHYLLLNSRAISAAMPWLEHLALSEEGRAELGKLLGLREGYDYATLISGRNITAAMPLLIKLTDTEAGRKLIVQILAPIQGLKVLLAAVPLLVNLSRDDSGRKLVMQMLTVENRNGETPLHLMYATPEGTKTSLEAALPLLLDLASYANMRNIMREAFSKGDPLFKDPDRLGVGLPLLLVLLQDADHDFIRLYYSEIVAALDNDWTLLKGLSTNTIYTLFTMQNESGATLLHDRNRLEKAMPFIANFSVKQIKNLSAIIPEQLPLHKRILCGFMNAEEVFKETGVRFDPAIFKDCATDESYKAAFANWIKNTSLNHAQIVYFALLIGQAGTAFENIDLSKEEKGEVLKLCPPDKIFDLIRIKDDSGKTQLFNPKVVERGRFLLEGLNPDRAFRLLITQDNEGRIPLHNPEWFKAAVVYLDSLFYEMRPAQIAYILFRKDHNGNTPLHNPELFKLAVSWFEKIPEDELESKLKEKNNAGVPLWQIAVNSGLKSEYLQKFIKGEPNKSVTQQPPFSTS